MAVNQFTHLNDDELLDYLGNDDGVEEVVSFDSSLTPLGAADDDSELPASFNWLDEIELQPVQSQGKCGACYVFASLAAIEAQMIMHHGSREKLSEQEAMECMK
jgi:C1A family cysteine protease